MKTDDIRLLLEGLASGKHTTEEVLGKLQKLPFEDLGFAKIDHHRRIRNGYPEVIYGEGKTTPQIVEIFARLAENNPNVLCTRANAAAAEAVRGAIEQLVGQKLGAGQLEEAPITLRDLDQVKDVFCRSMAGMYHHRIGYPRASGGIGAEFEPAERT